MRQVMLGKFLHRLMRSESGGMHGDLINRPKNTRAPPRVCGGN
jgi:hypothetical protein